MDIAIPVFGGLGLFLYGMAMMGDGLQKTAGDRLRRLIEVLTNNRLMGVLIGTVVTMIIQSSSATTVMVVGFVNAGLMTLPQATGVILGANIGTTITAQLIAFNITKYAPVFVGIGVVIWLSSKKQKLKDISDVLIGVGVLFIGMGMMSSGLKPLAEIPAFTEILARLQNPVLGLVVGVIMTTIIQSSSASIGLLQAVAGEGLVNMGMAFPILLGANIGTTTTALISSIGANRMAKRAAAIHFVFNIFGAIIFMLGFQTFIVDFVIKLSPGDVMRQIANAHTFYNFIIVAIFLPFTKFLVMAAEKVLPGKDEIDVKEAIYLDTRILETPSIALGQARKEVIRMGNLVSENLKLSREILVNDDKNSIETIFSTEERIDRIEKEITNYLVLLSGKSLTEEQHAAINSYLYTINDIERIGDHVENITELAEYKISHGLAFSQEAKDGLNYLFDKAEKVFITAMEAFETDDETLAREVLVLEDEIDEIEEKNREEHMDRLSRMECLTEPGVLFLDSLSNLERVSDHSANIAMYVLDKFK